MPGRDLKSDRRTTPPPPSESKGPGGVRPRQEGEIGAFVCVWSMALVEQGDCPSDKDCGWVMCDLNALSARP